jgi:hypothetical protein
MFLLVSLDDAKTALRIDTDDDDAALEIYLSAASLAVVQYLGGQASAVIQIDSPPNSPPDDLDQVDERVRLAVIMLAGMIYREPDGDTAGNFELGMLPKAVTALLYPLRDPVFS